MDLVDSEAGEVARQACLPCRKHKRKCGREVPACALCKRLGRACEYSTVSNVPHYESLAHRLDELQEEVTSMRQGALDLADAMLRQADPVHRAPPILFPSIFFLDSAQFEYSSERIRMPIVNLPPHYRENLGGIETWHEIADTHFRTIHEWLPIVAHNRFYRLLQDVHSQNAADLQLLLLAMRLGQQPVDVRQPLESEHYQLCKSAFTFVERSNLLSIYLVHAGIFIALYEIKHAIYPAAYLTCCNSANLAVIMGLHNNSKAAHLLPSPTTQNEYEERRRAWWAVVILDRYVRIGNRGHAIVAEESQPEDYLPTSDTNFEEGQLAIPPHLALATSPNLHASPFVRLCQAAHLLGQVIQHLDRRNVHNFEYHFDEAKQLRRTISALYAVIKEELAARSSVMSFEYGNVLKLLPAAALCCSALSNLDELYSCVEHLDRTWAGAKGLFEMQSAAIIGIQQTSREVLQLSRMLRECLHLQGGDKISPLVVDSLYQATAVFMWYRREQGREVASVEIEDLMAVLHELARYWHVADKYIDILKQSEERLHDDPRP